MGNVYIEKCGKANRDRHRNRKIHNKSVGRWKVQVEWLCPAFCFSRLYLQNIFKYFSIQILMKRNKKEEIPK